MHKLVLNFCNFSCSNLHRVVVVCVVVVVCTNRAICEICRLAGTPQNRIVKILMQRVFTKCTSHKFISKWQIKCVAMVLISDTG